MWVCRAVWSWSSGCRVRPRPHQPCPLCPRGLATGYLGESDEAKLLGQQRVVEEVNLGPDGLVDGAVAKVQLGGGHLQVRGGDHGVDGEAHWLDLRHKGQACAPRPLPPYTKVPDTRAGVWGLPCHQQPCPECTSQRAHVPAAVTLRVHPCASEGNSVGTHV